MNKYVKQQVRYWYLSSRGYSNHTFKSLKVDVIHNEEKYDFEFLYKLSAKVKFVFSKKATKIDEIFTVDLTLTYYIPTYLMSNRWWVKISSISLAFLENMNFISPVHLLYFIFFRSCGSGG